MINSMWFVRKRVTERPFAIVVASSYCPLGSNEWFNRVRKDGR